MLKAMIRWRQNRQPACLLAALFLFSLFSGCAAGAEGGYQERFSPNCVDMYLPCDPETGCYWEAWAEDESIIEIRETYFEYNRDLGMPGTGGIHWFHFNGLSEGVTAVTISYLRPWEINSPEIMFVYRMYVDATGNVMIWGMEMSDMRFIPTIGDDGDLAL